MTILIIGVIVLSVLLTIGTELFLIEARVTRYKTRIVSAIILPLYMLAISALYGSLCLTKLIILFYQIK